MTLILIVVGADTLITKLRATRWDHPLRVVMYPVNDDGSKAAAQYIEQLDVAHFDAIEQLAKSEAARYGINLGDPLHIDLAAPVSELPPLPPRNSNIVEIMWWSLKLRLWAHGADHYDGPRPEVRAFAIYYDPETHPTGLEKRHDRAHPSVCIGTHGGTERHGDAA